MKKLTLAAMAAAALALTGMAKAQTTLYGDHEITGSLQVDGDIIGRGNLAVGTAATATENSYALGLYAAAGHWSIALGDNATAGYWSIALGDSATAGYYGAALGSSSAATGGYSLALGNFSIASGDSSTAIGVGAYAMDAYSTAIGAVTSDSYASMVVWANNTPLGGSSYSWVTTNPLFVVGNGTSSESLHNALVMLKNGKLSLYGTSSATPRIVFDPDNSQITVGGQALLAPNSGGNVGIGTSSPSEKLEINSGNILLSNAFGLQGRASNGSPVLLLRLDNNNRTQFGDTSTGEAMTLSSGKVGIGINTPQEKLQVSGRILAGQDRGTATNLLYGIASGGSAAFIDLISDQYGSHGFGAVTGIHIGSPVVYMYDNPTYGNSFTVGKIVFNANPATDLTPLLTVKNTGNVGIGTTAPAAKLDVNGNGAIGAGLSDIAADQVVVGRYNNNNTNDTSSGSTSADHDHTQGVFIVGAGTSTTKSNAIRVLTDGTVLVKASGDIPMGVYTGGAKP